MDILKNPKYKKIVTLIFILVILVTLNCLRYKNTASKTFDNGVVKWQRDNWTGTDWITVYSGYKSDRLPVDCKDARENTPLGNYCKNIILLSKTLTIAWYILFFADVALVIYLYNKKEKEGTEL